MNTALEYFQEQNLEVREYVAHISWASGQRLLMICDSAFRELPPIERFLVEDAAAATAQGRHTEARHIIAQASTPEAEGSINRVLDRMRKDGANGAIRLGEHEKARDFIASVTPANQLLAQIGTCGTLFEQAEALARSGGLSNLKSAIALVRTAPIPHGERMAEGLDIYVLQSALGLAESAWPSLADRRAQLASSKNAYIKIRDAAREAQHARNTTNDTPASQRLSELLAAAPLPKRRLLMRIDPGALLIADDAARNAEGSGFPECLAVLRQINVGGELAARQVAATLVNASQTIARDKGLALGD